MTIYACAKQSLNSLNMIAVSMVFEAEYTCHVFVLSLVELQSRFRSIDPCETFNSERVKIEEEAGTISYFQKQFEANLV